MPWLTPDTEGGTVYRLLSIPEGFLSQVNGALLPLEIAYNWEEYGALTPQQCASVMSAMINDYFEGNMLLGLIMPWAGDINAIPDNLLLCDGSSNARVDYPSLYAVLASAYIDDADTFHTPNMVDNFPLGADENTGETGGEETHTLSTDEMPTHNHEDSGHVHSEIAAVVSLFPEGLEAPQPTTLASVISTGIGYANIQNAGGGEAHNNMPPYHAIVYVMIAR